MKTRSTKLEARNKLEFNKLEFIKLSRISEFEFRIYYMTGPVNNNIC